MSKLVFNDISDELIKNDHTNAGRGNLFELQTGDNLLRIMPPWAAGRKYYKAYKMHFGLGELINFGLEIDGWYKSPCLADDGGKCPLCALATKAKATGTRTNDLTLTELNKVIRAKQQYACNVVDMSNPDKGVQTMTFGKKIFDDLQGIFSRKGNITHPINGFNVIVTKREIPNQKWADYGVSIDEREDISKYWEKFSSQLIDLDKHPELPAYEDIKMRVEGIELVAPNSGRPSQKHTTIEIPAMQAPKVDDLDSYLDGIDD